MGKMDFHNAGINHLIWKKRLRGLLNGRVIISEVEKISPKDCELGKWLYSDGLNEYGKMEEMQELERIHAEAHAMGNRIIHFHDDGKIKEAEIEFKKLNELSKKIIGILTNLSIQVDTEKQDKPEEKKEIKKKANKVKDKDKGEDE